MDRVERLRALRGGDNGAPPTEVHLAVLSSIAREQVRWLWPERVPLGMLTLLIGDPGLGKSLLGLLLASRVSQAGGDVLLLSAEDHAGATIRPRAEAVGADLDRLHIVGMRRHGMEDGLALPDDAAELDRAAERTGARLVIVDPLMAHLPGSVNSWHDQSIRTALAPLHRISQDRGLTMFLIAHLNKSRGDDPLYRAGGSIGLPAAVRSCLLLARDPSDPEEERGTRRVLAHIKCNVAPQAESLSCQVDPVLLPGDEQLQTARMVITGTSETSAGELLASVSGEERSERDEAVEFLTAELKQGPRKAKEISKAAREAEIGPGSLKRAKRALGVRSAKDGLDGGWSWSLPEGDGPKGTDPIYEKPSPSSPSHEQAVSDPPKGDGFPEGDGSGDIEPLWTVDYTEGGST